ncbi:MAG: serine hydrolase [Thermoguttaceae bacterium]
MNVRWSCLLTAVICCAAASLGAAGDEPDLKPKVDALVQPLLESETVVGLAIGLTQRGQKSTFGYGKISAATDKTPDERTLFEIGSVTKVFTALALADMVQEKLVALDDPVSKWLPESVEVPRRGPREITLLDLATHTSGLPRLPRNLVLQALRNPEDPYAGYTLEQLYEGLAACRLASDPGTRYAYSNLGMGLLGHVLARREGASYEELILKRICRPLEMHETRITLAGPLKDRFAQGHNLDGMPVPAWQIPTVSGAGAFRSTVHDLLLFVEANLGLRAGRLAKAMEMTHLPRHQTISPPGRIALGWHIGPDGVYWHNGQTGGFHSMVAFDRQRQIGVVVLSNTGTGVVDALADQLMRHLSGKPVEPLKLPKPLRLDPAILDQYAGDYELLPGFVLRVTCQKDKLWVQATGQPRFRVYPESETRFFYRVVDARITFVRDADGKVNRLILHQHGLDLPAFRGGIASSLVKWLREALRQSAAGAEPQPLKPEAK